MKNFDICYDGNSVYIKISAENKAERDNLLKIATKLLLFGEKPEELVGIGDAEQAKLEIPKTATRIEGPTIKPNIEEKPDDTNEIKQTTENASEDVKKKIIEMARKAKDGKLNVQKSEENSEENIEEEQKSVVTNTTENLNDEENVVITESDTETSNIKYYADLFGEIYKSKGKDTKKMYALIKEFNDYAKPNFDKLLETEDSQTKFINSFSEKFKTIGIKTPALTGRTKNDAKALFSILAKEYNEAIIMLRKNMNK